MALIRIEFRFASRYRPGVMAVHGGRDQCVQFTMPKVDRHADRFERKIPLAAVEATIESWSACAGAKSLAAAFQQNVAQTRARQGKAVAFRQAVGVLHGE